MKFLPVVWRNLLRRKVRTIFTLGVDLHRVRALRLADGGPIAFSMGVEMAGADRLMVMHKGRSSSRCRSQYEQQIAVARRDRRHARHVVRRELPGQGNQFATVATEPAS